MKTARAARLLVAGAVLRRARRITAAVFFFLFAAYIAVFVVTVSRVSAGAVEHGTWQVILALGICLLAAALVAILTFFLLGRLYGGNRDPRRRTELATLYVRGLLIDTFSRYREPLSELNCGKAVLKDAKTYATEYALELEECAALLRPATMREEGERIRFRYETYLRAILETDEQVRVRHFRNRDKMYALADRWRRLHFPSYGKEQQKLLDHNIAHILQAAIKADPQDLGTSSAMAHLETFEGVTMYRDPSNPASVKTIPKKGKSDLFADIVKKIKAFDTDAMSIPLGGARLDDYKELLDAYEAFEAEYTTVGCDTVNLAKCRTRYRDAVDDVIRCWRCKKPFHPRHKQICKICGQYICSSCGKCYCDKHITHRIARNFSDD